MSPPNTTFGPLGNPPPSVPEPEGATVYLIPVSPVIGPVTQIDFIQDSSPPEWFTKCIFLIQAGSNTQGLIEIETVFDRIPLDLNNVSVNVMNAIALKIHMLWGLCKYEEALQYLNTIAGSGFNSQYEGPPMLLRKLKEMSEKFLFQSKIGNYPILELLDLDEPATSIIYWNFGEFTGPVKASPGSRGLIATRDVAAGQLIFFLKPYAINFELNEDVPVPEDLRVDHLTSTIYGKLTTEPSSSTSLAFCDLYPGEGSNQDGNWLKNEIATNNLAELDEHSKQDIMTAIKNRVVTNSFSNLDSKNFRYGLWILPSRMNHNCTDANAWWKCIGNFLMVRAVKNIAAGEEITISCTKTEPENSRKKILQRRGFTCSCNLCTMERGESKKFKAVLDTKLTELQTNFGRQGERGKRIRINSSAAIAAIEEVVKLRAVRFSTPTPLQDFALLDFRVQSVLRNLMPEINNKGVMKILERTKNIAANIGLMDLALKLDFHLMIRSFAMEDVIGSQRFLGLTEHDLHVWYGTPIDLEKDELQKIGKKLTREKEN